VIQSLFQGVFDWLNSTYIEPSIRALKLRAVIGYLEIVKGSHQILFLVCMLVFVITLIGAGLVILPIALLLLRRGTRHESCHRHDYRGTVSARSCGGAGDPAIEKRWMRLTGASDMLRKLVD